MLALDYVNTLPGYKAGTLNLVAFSKARISFARKGNWYYKGAWGDHGSTGKIGYVLNPSDDSGFILCLCSMLGQRLLQKLLSMHL